MSAEAYQKSVRRHKIRTVRLNSNKPAVYLTLVKVGKIKPLHVDEEEAHIWLRIHNNTKWPIWLQASGIPNSKYGDISAYYDIEDYNTGNKVIQDVCHVCSTIPLASGKTLDFIVPTEYLVSGRRLRTYFSFDWEDRDDVFAGREAEHSLLFYDHDLTRQVK